MKFLLIIGLLSRICRALDFFVDEAYAGSDSDGKKATPFKTIASGLNALSATGGSLTVLSLGTNKFTDKLEVNKPIKLIASSNGAVLNLSGAAVGITVNKDGGLIIEGFELVLSDMGVPKDPTFKLAGGNFTLRNGKISVEPSVSSQISFIECLGAGLILIENEKIEAQNLSGFERFLNGSQASQSTTNITLKNFTLLKNTLTKDIFLSISKAISLTLSDVVFSENRLPEQASETATRIVFNLVLEPEAETKAVLRNLKVEGNFFNKSTVFAIEYPGDCHISDSAFGANYYANLFEITQSNILSVRNSMFSNNNLPDGEDFSGILWAGASVLVHVSNEVTLERMNVSGSHGFAHPPGVYLFEVVKATLNNVIFEKNVANLSEKADERGCAFYARDDAEKGSFLIKDSSFMENNLTVPADTTEGGPGLFLIMPGGEVIIDNVFITDNKVNDGGSGLYAEAQVLVLNNSFVERNGPLNGSDAEKESMSGAIYIKVRSFTINNTECNENFAYKATCFLYEALENFDYQEFIAENCNFANNNAKDYSSVMYSNSFTSNRSLVWRNCDFISNVGKGLGGVFFFVVSDGAHVHNYTFYDCVFLENKAGDAGGIVEIYVTHPNNCFLFFIRCNFTANALQGEDETSVLGGVIDVWGEELSDLDMRQPAVTTIGCWFERHETFSGSSVALNRAGYHDYNSTFIRNKAFLDGSGFMTINSYVKLVGTKFIASESLLNGGAISLREASMADIIGCSFKDSKAKRGGAVAADIASNMSVIRCVFENNAAEIGSIILISNGDNYRSEIINCTFRSNTAEFSALIVIEYAQIEFNTSFFYNSLSNILSLSETTGNLSVILFINNSCASLLEGCIGAIKDNSNLLFTNLMIQDVRTRSKGGAFDVYLSNLTLANSTFTRINSQNDGGFINTLFSSIVLMNISVIEFTPDGINAEQSSIKIYKSLFRSSPTFQSLKKGALICLKCEELYLFQCAFEFLSTEGNAAVLFVQQNASLTANFILENCTFSNNFAKLSGGVIYNEDAYLILKSNLFQNNKAVKSGGVLFHTCTDDFSPKEICIIEMRSNKFNNNSAEFEGGVIKWIYNRPIGFNENEFTGNTAGVYGDIMASFPIRFGLRIYESSESPVLLYNYSDPANIKEKYVNVSGEKSGGVIGKRLEFDLLDTEGQVFKGKSDVILKAELVKDESYFTSHPWMKTLLDKQTHDKFFNNTNTTYVFGTTSEALNDNYTCVFDSINVVSTPTTAIFLRFYTTDIPTYLTGFMRDVLPNEMPDPRNSSSAPNYQFILPVEVRECLVGEIYNNVENTCDQCAKGKYSFDPRLNDKCLECPDKMTCNGGANVTISQGYWRSSAFSINIYQCDVGLNACIGGVGYKCKENHKGKLCEECDVDRNGVQTKKNVLGECKTCLDVGLMVFLIFVLSVALILFSYYIIRVFITGQHYSPESRLRFKIIINYFQGMYLIPIKNLSLPDYKKNYLWVNHFLTNVSGTWFSLDCLYINFGMDTSDSESVSEFNNIAMATFVFVLTMIIFFALFKLVEYRKGTNLHNERALTFFILAYFLYPSFMYKTLSPMNCTEIDGGYFIQESLYTACDDSKYLIGIIVLCIPNFLFWNVFCPWFGYRYFKRITAKNYIVPDATESKQPPKYKEKHIFFLGYKDELRKWEGVIFARKVLLLIVAALLSRHHLRMIISLVIFQIAFLMHVSYRPFLSNEMNKLEGVSLGILTFTYYGLIFYILDIEQSTKDLLFSFTMLLHLLLFLYILWDMFFRSYWNSLKERLGIKSRVVSAQSRKIMEGPLDKKAPDQPTFPSISNDGSLFTKVHRK